MGSGTGDLKGFSKGIDLPCLTYSQFPAFYEGRMRRRPGTPSGLKQINRQSALTQIITVLIFDRTSGPCVSPVHKEGDEA
jgi:hypothetical protein